MPYATPPKCFICGKVHPCDTNDTVQLVGGRFLTVNVCKSHTGVIEEYNRQENLPIEEKAELARSVVSTPEFQTMYSEYTDHLIRENPMHKKFLENIRLF